MGSGLDIRENFALRHVGCWGTVFWVGVAGGIARVLFRIAVPITAAVEVAIWKKEETLKAG
jgi:hypothetical protein